jgi:hypothetical protein
MADYYPLIARAVAGLEKNTGEGRRILYERARTALVTQLRGVVPALSESDITRERLGLEEAIRKVEAEAARQSREGPRPDLPPPQPLRRDSPRDTRLSPPGDFNRPAPPLSPPPLPNRSSEAPRLDPHAATMRRPPRPRDDGYPDEGIKGLRDVVAEAENLGGATAQASRSARQAFAAAPSASPEQSRLEPRLEPEGMRSQRKPAEAPPGISPPLGTVLEPEFGGSLESPMLLEDARPRPRRAPEPEEQEEHVEVRRPIVGGGFLRVLVAVMVVLLVTATVFWQRHTLMSVVRAFMPTTQSTSEAVVQPASRDVTPGRAKIPDRISPSGQNSPPDAVAQRVVLYEEDPSDPAGKQFVGTAVWHTETVSPGPGLPPDTVIRADIEVPDRQMKVSWSLRRNLDKTLPASHTVDIMFTLPTDFAHGGIDTIPGLLMKQNEQTRGVPLAGQSVKVTTGYFLIGLSSVESDLQRNVQLLKERAWFDIPIVYSDRRRAILAVEKGSPGERAFADAFTSWSR